MFERRESLDRSSEGYGFDPRLGLRNHYLSIELEDRSSTSLFMSSTTQSVDTCTHRVPIFLIVCASGIQFETGIMRNKTYSCSAHSALQLFCVYIFIYVYI